MDPMLRTWRAHLASHHPPRLMAKPGGVALGWTQTKEWNEWALGKPGGHKAVCAKAPGLDIAGKARKKAGDRLVPGSPYIRTEPETRGEPSRCNTA